MRASSRTWIAGLAACLAIAAMPAHADGYGRHRGGHGGGFWGGWIPIVGVVALGLAAAQLNAAAAQPPVVVQAPPPPPAPPAVQPAPAVVPGAAAAAPYLAAAEWIAYPRDGQSPAQLEADRQACRQWAGTVPGAAADIAMFRRAEAACLDGRGYTVR